MLDKNQDSLTDIEGYTIHVIGRVQGVGFRPFIYRLATEFDLKGYVLNRPDGVIIGIEGPSQNCELFVEAMTKQLPPAARIKEIVKEPVEINNYTEFNILPSKPSDKIITEICPDIAVCDDCLKELYTPDNRRYLYPFINCTNCGPRFTLTDDFPYDRRHTTMHEFTMCPDCSSEYHDVNDRRFHAQPVACNACGPAYQYYWNSEIFIDFKDIIKLIGKQLKEGKLVALKGLGGYNLACDALNREAVAELRRFKRREKKPFAIMFRSIKVVEHFAQINEVETNALLSWRRPIVILDQFSKNSLPGEIMAGLKSLGAFLPYLPLHYLLFNEIETDAVILTSGNESEVPILYTEGKALEIFRDISGGILSNNRKIARRIDDSVVKIIADQPRIFRRARGYVPSPVDMNFKVDGILATGAELSNCFCLGKEQQAILSQHIGDLKNADTYDFFTENICEFSRMYQFHPEKIACDLHPDYLSTRYADQLNIPVTRIQHHHAHIAAVMAEYQLVGTVIGISYDGSGYGTDGNIWGSELLIAGYGSFERISHFEYIALPGGDLAVKETWRSALAYLYHAYGDDWKNIAIPFLQNIDLNKADKLIEAIDKKINTPLCCSAGRLFDAVAALLVICIESDYHAQAPMLLEKYIDPGFTSVYPFIAGQQISLTPMIKAIIADITERKDHSEIVTKFHNTIAMAALGQVKMAYGQSKIRRVVLSGGTFQNKYLTEKLVFLLERQHFEVFLPTDVPCNDGGIALGQIAVAAFKFKG